MKDVSTNARHVGAANDPVRLDTPDSGAVVLSDLHLGHDAPLCFPRHREGMLSGVIMDAARQRQIIVLNGDIIDALQCRKKPAQVLDAHPSLKTALETACRDTQVIYVMGNHDPEPDQVRQILPWRVCDAVILDEQYLIVHGHQFDEILRGRRKTLFSILHAWLQSVVGVPLHPPIDLHWTLRNRLFFAIICSVCEALLLLARFTPNAKWLVRFKAGLDALARDDLRTDPRGVLHTLAADLERFSLHHVICGHTHQPGKARVGALEYVNSGSWMHGLGTAVYVRDGEVRVVDHLNHRTWDYEVYQDWRRPVDWSEWWRVHARQVHPRAILRDFKGWIMACVRQSRR